MKLQDVMTKETFSCKPDDSIQEIAKVMKEHDIGSLPIVDNNKVIGIVTDRDIVLEAVAENKTDVTAKDIMTDNPITGNPDMDIEDASITMAEYQIRRLPIVDNEELVGFVAIGDLAVKDETDEEAGEALSEISEESKPE